MTKLEKYLTTLVDKVQPQIEEKMGRKDICVLSTSVAYHMLTREFPDIFVTPLLCDAQIFNKVAYEHIKKTEALLKNSAPPEQIEELNQEAIRNGAKIVAAVQNQGTAGGLHGHMILSVVTYKPRPRYYLLDMTIAQFNRPSHGIEVPAFFVRMRKEDTAELGLFRMIALDGPGGIVLTYQRQHRERAEIESMPDWVGGRDDLHLLVGGIK